MKDLVLTVERGRLPQAWLVQCGGVFLPDNALSTAFDLLEPCWVSRQHAEKDPRYKQLIPYILVRHDGRLAAYRRRGTEARLHGYWSIGVGGHVDYGDRGRNLTETLLAGARRELFEELPGLKTDHSLTLLGVINEEHSEVGTVHLGVVMMATVNGHQAPVGGQELLDLGWLPPPKLQALELELWSCLALDLYQTHVAASTPLN